MTVTSKKGDEAGVKAKQQPLAKNGQLAKRAYSARPNARKERLVDYQASDVESVAFNRVAFGDCVQVLRQVPARSVDLVILDPPYWKVVGETWDYRWRTEADYRQWCREWFAEVARVCKQSASVYLFGYMRNLVHLFHDICAAGFEFRQEITIDKGIKSVAGRKTSTYKQFPNTTETVFFFVFDPKPAIREFLLKAQAAAGLSAKQINERLGVKSNGGGVWSLYTGKNILGQVPTREMWGRLEQVLNCTAPEELKGFTFNQQLGLTNVWSDINFYEERRIHPTQKPLKLIERLVLASSREGDTILDPFCGSGTSVVAATKNGRRCWAIEADPQMVAAANERIDAAIAQLRLL